MKVDKRIALPIIALVLIGSGVALAVSKPTTPQSPVKTEAVTTETPAASVDNQATTQPEPVKATHTTTQADPEPTPDPVPVTLVSKNARWTEGTGDTVAFFWTCDSHWSDGTVTSKSIGSSIEPDNYTHQPRTTLVCPKN